MKKLIEKQEATIEEVIYPDEGVDKLTSSDKIKQKFREHAWYVKTVLADR